jgi:hypothetical protein
MIAIIRVLVRLSVEKILAVLIIASDPPSFDLTRIGRCSSNVRGGLVPVLLPSFADIRLFSGVDNFLEARRLGFDFQEEMLPNLRKSSSLTTLGSRSMLTVVYAFISVCQAARRSSEASSFSIAANYLSAIELFLDLDSTLTWQTRRSLCMDIVKLLAEIGAVQKDWSAVDRVRAFPLPTFALLKATRNN